MRKITQEELNKKLQENKPNLSNLDLTGLWLSDANLSGADLHYANLSGANLICANLSGANLSYVDLRGANLYRANLSYANLSYVDLRGVNLCHADLSGADLSGADLSGVNLCRADLSDANIYFPLHCPEQGSFIGYKKVGDCIITLEIPAEAKRSSATTKKCRCEFAKVLSIESRCGEKKDKIINATYPLSIIYEVGKMVYPDSYDENRWNECSHGIHFFITKQEAINY